jgi:hypothetical protein
MTSESGMREEAGWDTLDAILARHPFGDSDYITGQMHICYKRRLDKLALRLPAARRLRDALDSVEPHVEYRAIGDTVLRCAVQHAQVEVETGLPYGIGLQQCEEVFEETVRLLERGDCAPLGSGLTECFGPTRRESWVWSEQRRDDVFARALTAIVEQNYGDMRPCTPNADELHMLGRGVELLARLLPRSSCSALGHTHLTFVFAPHGSWATTMSSSEFKISGTIFLNRNLLSNPWIVAEHLYHESLHQQIYDIRAGHLLLNPDFARPGAPLIHSPWNRPDSSLRNYWDVHRALAAFHVYVHLSLLASLAEQRAAELEEYGPVMMMGRRTSLVRAHYLAEQLRACCWDELGPAGKQLVEWFTSILEPLDAAPPARGAYVHLLLDRYWREATGVAAEDGEGPPALASRLAVLLEEEVARTRSVLRLMNVPTEAFDRALRSCSGQDAATRFLSVRTLIAETILTICPESFRLSESMEPDEVVKHMVEDSSEVLNRLLEA